ncbi:MAG: Flp pilus assembly protein CpaB [Planctomycetaceae bacterium]|nr:Flp pilus assembly protein CpaB [Planctomycetaceae bacterium]
MKSQSIMLLVVAAVFGLFAMFGVKQAMNSKSEPERPRVTVLQAAMDINVGQELDETNTQMVEIDQAVCPEGAVGNFEDIKERSSRVPLVAGDWILVSKLSGRGERGAGGIIPPGMRVSTIPVDATQTHSGLLLPGNRIDIILSHNASDATGQRHQVSRTILQYIEVFAVDNQVYGIDKTGEKGAGAKNISVLVTPEQAHMLQLAKSMGQLSTSLRSNSDMEEVAAMEMSDEVLGRFGGSSGIGTTGVMDYRDRFTSGDIPELPDDEFANPDEFLRAELSRTADPGPEGSMPVIQLAENKPVDIENSWSIEIQEGDTLRTEYVRLPTPAEAEPTEEETDTQANGTGFWNFLKKSRIL